MSKSKKIDFEWTQDSSTVTIKYEIKSVSLKKIDVYIAPFFLKINVQERNLVKYIDFYFEVDFSNKENTILYIDQVLEVKLLKKSIGLWSDITDFSLDKENIFKRRQESISIKENFDKDFNKKLNDLKIEHDRYSVNEQMRLERNERDYIESKKKMEKEKAEQEIYKDIDEDRNFVKRKDENATQQITAATNLTNLDDNEKKIFAEEDYNQTEKMEEHPREERVIPDVRNQNSVQIKFTEKVYPHLAAREHHLKDQPFPKIRQASGKDEQAGDELGSENPLWLKDKADEFYRNNDYYSAINAYNIAYKKDNKLLVCISNRSACHFNLFNYCECINDCNAIIDYYDKSPEPEKEDKDLKKIFFKALWRKALALSWSGNLEKSEKILLELKAKSDLPEEYKILIDETIEVVEKRKKSIQLKKYGDIEFKKAEYIKAIEKYKQALEQDPDNEIILGNISLCLFKMDKDDDSLQFLERALKKMKGFIQYANFSESYRQSSYESRYLIIKLLLRKAQILKKSKEFDKCKDIIKEAIQIDDKNQEAQQLLKDIEEILVSEVIQKLKQEAQELIKNGNFQPALSIYNDCLNKIKQNSTQSIIDYLSILLNKSICHFKLEQYDDILNLSIRGLKIIRNLKNRIIAIDQIKLTNEERTKLTDFEVRFLLRKGNAYLKQNQIYNAKSEFEDALKLSPNNEDIKRDLEKIKQLTN